MSRFHSNPEKERLLLVFLHGIGDSIMMTGCVRELHRAHPNSSIELLLLDNGSSRVWEYNPHVDRVHISTLSENPRYWSPWVYWPFDHGKVHGEIERVRAKSGPYSDIVELRIQNMPEVFYRIFRNYKQHKAQRMARELGLDYDNLNYEIFLQQDDTRQAYDFIDSQNLSDFAVLHPFSRDIKRCMGQELTRDVIDILKDRGLEVIVTGTSKEEEMYNIEGSKGCFELAFRSLLALIQKAAIFIGTDSGVAHLAAVSQTPIVVVSTKGVGSFIQNTGNAEWYLPLSEKARCIELKKTAKFRERLETTMKELGI